MTQADNPFTSHTPLIPKLAHLVSIYLEIQKKTQGWKMTEMSSSIVQEQNLTKIKNNKGERMYKRNAVINEIKGSKKKEEKQRKITP